jgi:hypothetical protein
MQGGRRRGRWPAALLAGLAIACSGDPGEPEVEETLLDARDTTAAPGENQPPAIRRLHLEPGEPVRGDTVRAVVTARDPDGDRVELAYRWRVAGERMPESGPEIRLGEVDKGDEVEVEVVASDGTWEGEPARASAEVRNRRPVVVGVRLDPAPNVAPGQKLTAVAVGDDEDGDEVEFRYAWRVNGRSVDADGPALDTAGLDRGDEIQVRVTAHDGEAESDPVESVRVQVGNSSPDILSDPTGLREDGAFVYQVEARDPDGDRNLRFSLRQAPEGMRVDPVLGEVTWHPTAKQAGRHTVEVVVEDRHGASALQRFDLDVAIAGEAPAAPAR